MPKYFMAVIKYERGSVTTVLSTELNGMANGNRVISAAIDNTTDLNLFEDLVLSTNTFSSAPDSGAIVTVFLIEAMDGTAFVDGDSTIDSPAVNLVEAFDLRAVTTSQRHIIRGIVIPSNKFKYAIIQKTGQTWASSGNTIRRRPYKHKAG